MIKSLEPIFHQINSILSKYVEDDNIISKLKNLIVIVQVEINKLPKDCSFKDACRERFEEEYECEPKEPYGRDDID